MTLATRTLLEALIRLGKGALGECEKWVKAQQAETAAPLINTSPKTWHPTEEHISRTQHAQ